ASEQVLIAQPGSPLYGYQLASSQTAFHLTSVTPPDERTEELWHPRYVRHADESVNLFDGPWAGGEAENVPELIPSQSTD
ncbi:hypothetical protein BaRGS_00020430, partial [Batillaria attramentaria]